MFKFAKMLKWLLAMKKKHNTYSFSLLCSGNEIIISPIDANTHNVIVDDEIRLKF